MKKPFGKHFILMGFLFILITISTIAGFTADNTPTYVEGEDCIPYHKKTYLRMSLELNYLGAAKPGDELNFSINYYTPTNGMVFNLTVELPNFPEELLINEGASTQSRSNMSEDSFTSSWIINSNQEGNFTFDIKSTISVQFLYYHEEYTATYEIWHTASFEVSEESTEPPYLVPYGSLEEDINPYPINWKNITGQILGFLSIVLVYLCIQLAIPERKEKIRNKFGWTAAKTREIHCDLGYVTMASIVLHNIILSQTALWSLYFKWYQFYPVFYTFRDGWSGHSVGLDLAVLGSLIFVIATVAGMFFKKIARKFGYKTAIFSQQISYLALIFSVLHSLLNGRWTKDFWILYIIQIALLAEVLISRYVAYVHAYDLKLAKRRSKLEILEVSEQNAIDI
ncbi:MAG: hypothetical protein ACTSYI_00420 [Promethearchaeota archaeon]